MEDKKVNNQIKLDNLLLIKSDFKRELIILAEDRSKITQTTDIDIDSSDLKLDKFSVYLHVDHKIMYDTKPIVEIKINYSGTFDKSNTSLDAAALDTFIDVNAPAIIFPFVREHIASLTAKAGIGSVLLQPVNFIELSKNRKASKPS